MALCVHRQYHISINLTTNMKITDLYSVTPQSKVRVRFFHSTLNDRIPLFDTPCNACFTNCMKNVESMEIFHFRL